MKYFCVKLDQDERIRKLIQVPRTKYRHRGTHKKETETGTFDQISVKGVNYLVPWIEYVVNLTDEASMDRTFNTVDDVEPWTKVAAAVDAAGVKEIAHK